MRSGGGEEEGEERDKKNYKRGRAAEMRAREEEEWNTGMKQLKGDGRKSQCRRQGQKQDASEMGE